MAYSVLRTHEIKVKSSETDDANMNTVKAHVKDKTTLCLYIHERRTLAEMALRCFGEAKAAGATMIPSTE